MLRLILASVFLLVLVTPFQAAGPPSPSPARIDRLIRQLGSDRFEEREAATEALARLGRVALPALRKATTSRDLEVRVRASRLVRRMEEQLYRHLLTFGEGNKAVYCLVFSPDGRRLLSGSWDNRIHLWDPETGKELWRGEGHTGLLRGVAFSPKGRRAVSASLDQSVRVWDLRTGKQLHCLKGHTDNAMSACFSPDGKTVATGSNDSTIRLWDAETGKERLCIRDRDRAWVVVFSPDGKLLLSAGGYKDFSVRVREAATGREVRRLTGHTNSVESLAVSMDGRTVLTGGWDGTVRHWDLSSGKELCCLKGHRGEVEAVALSPNGKWAASGGSDGVVRVWNLVTGKGVRDLLDSTRLVKPVLFTPGGQSVNALSFSPDGKRLAAGSSDQTIRVWAIPEE